MSESVPFTDQETERDLTDSDDFLERVKRRAYELSQSDESRTDEENWHQAEREVREQSDSP